MTVDPRAYDALVKLSEKRSLDKGRAFDVVLNFMLMYHPDFFGDQDYTREKNDWVKAEVEKLKGEFYHKIDILFTEVMEKSYDEQLAERAKAKVSERTDVISDSVKVGDDAIPELQFTYEQILERCKEKVPGEIEAWVKEGRWGAHIEATGHSIDEFVAEKFARVMKKIQEAPKPVEEKPVERKVDIKKVMQNVEEKMNDHWLNLNGQLRGMRSSDTTRFYVAYQVRNFNKALDDMDNGHKQETADELQKQLEQAATIRKWPKDQYMSEFQSIWSTYEKIVADQQEQMRKETPGMKKGK